MRDFCCFWWKVGDEDEDDEDFEDAIKAKAAQKQQERKQNEQLKKAKANSIANANAPSVGAKAVKESKKKPGKETKVLPPPSEGTESPADKIPRGQNPSRTKSTRFGQLWQNARDIFDGWTKFTHLIFLHFQQLIFV